MLVHDFELRMARNRPLADFVKGTVIRSRRECVVTTCRRDSDHADNADADAFIGGGHNRK
jgi:hypothetical protein